MKTNTLRPALLLPTPFRHLSHLPPPLSSLSPLSSSTPSQRCREKEGCRGKRGVGTKFCLPLVFHCLLKEKNSPSLHLPLFPHLVCLPSLLFLAVSPRASICHCYIQDCLLHESKWEWGNQWGCGGWDEKKWTVGWKGLIEEWKWGRFIHPFLVMVQLVFLL